MLETTMVNTERCQIMDGSKQSAIGGWNAIWPLPFSELWPWYPEVKCHSGKAYGWRHG